MDSVKKKTIEEKFDSFFEAGWRVSIDKDKSEAFPNNEKMYQLTSPTGKQYDICKDLGDIFSEFDFYEKDTPEEEVISYKIIGLVEKLSPKDRVINYQKYSKK